MNKYRHKLSKSSYISGKQCEKRLYLQKHHRELAAPYSVQQEAIMEQGTTVGELARKRFPGGIDATPESYYNFAPSIELTQKAIAEDEPTIYEAAFFHDQILAALDIWHLHQGEKWAIEVKSSTSVKDYHLDDAALQYWVMSQNGHAPDRFFIMHINNQYVRGKELDVEQFFSLTEVTEAIKAKQAEVSENLNRFKALLDEKEVPQMPIGEHCSDPFDCEFKPHCWAAVPFPSVFNLRRIGANAFTLYEAGRISYEDLTHEESLNERQMLQVQSFLKEAIHIKREAISELLQSWEFPLYFFDFETINPAIPLYEGTKPYEQIGVQYSMHLLESADSDWEHKAFLSDFEGDPRPALIQQMLKDLGSSGSIVAYNMSFEQRVITSLAESYPQFAEDLLALLPRFVDLIDPFRKGHFYHPEMHGSASIKAVLPALFPNDAELSYKALSVSDGGAASTLLQAMAEKTIDPEVVTQIRHDLLAYCKLDTLAMVKIWERLGEDLKKLRV